MAIENGIIPPTINHEDGDNDPEIDYNLNFTFNKAQKKEVNAALSNTFGFGGHNASAIFKKYKQKRVLRKILRKIRAIPHKGKEPYLSFYKILGFYPDRINLYNEAVTHRSSSIRSEKGRWVNNERLEFLGDAILDAIVADILYKKYEHKKEGFLTNMRSRIVQRETLNKLRGTRIGQTYHLFNSKFGA